MPKPKTEAQLAAETAALRQKIADLKHAEAVNASAMRALQRRARDKRRYQVGTLVDEAGLAGLADDVLRGLLAGLARIAQTPSPVSALEAILWNVSGIPGKSVDGCAAPGERVSRTD
jgi:hypothetical protein